MHQENDNITDFQVNEQKDDDNISGAMLRPSKPTQTRLHARSSNDLPLRDLRMMPNQQTDVLNELNELPTEFDDVKRLQSKAAF